MATEGGQSGPRRAVDREPVAGRYRITGRLGRGGMGTVWRATDEVLGRQVAVKELNMDGTLSAEEQRVRRRRALREARSVAQVRHPHVVVLHDVVEHDGQPWIVMELVDGRSLADVLAQEGPVEPREAARIGAAVTAALRAAHGRGVLHRDIKPANVLMENGTGRVVLTDFGIARVVGSTTLTEVGAFAGSPEYTAPERVSGGTGGPASDLWSVGVLLCTAVAGRSPFQRDSFGGVLHAVVYGEMRLPEAAGPLLPVVRGLLERDPERRTGAAEAEQALRAYAEEGTLPGASAAPDVPAGTGGSTAEAGGSAAGAVRGATPPPPSRSGSATGSAAAPSAFDPAVASGRTAASGPEAGPEAGPGAESARGPEDDTVPAPVPRGRRRTGALLAGGLAVAAVGVLVVSVGQPGGGRGGAAAGPAGAGSVMSAGPTSAGPTSDGSASAAAVTHGPTVPAGFRRVSDPGGFSLAVAEGFYRSVEPPRTFYYSPGREFRLGIRDQAPAPGGPAAVMRRQDEDGPGLYPGYRDGIVTLMTQHGQPAALWEFTWNGFKGDDPRRTYDLCWTENGRQYDVWVSAPLPKAEQGRLYWETARDTFEPR